MNLQADTLNKRKGAQTPVLRELPLASAAYLANLIPADGAIIPATSVVHLFRTPSLRGQVSSPAGLPVFLFINSILCDFGRLFAQNDKPGLIRLHAPLQMSSVPLSSSEQQRGSAECTSPNSVALWRYLARLRPVATRSANRPCSARVRGPGRRLCWMATLSPALPSVRRPIWCIASKTRKTATDQPLCPQLPTGLRRKVVRPCVGFSVPTASMRLAGRTRSCPFVVRPAAHSVPSEHRTSQVGKSDIKRGTGSGKPGRFDKALPKIGTGVCRNNRVVDRAGARFNPEQDFGAFARRRGVPHLGAPGKSKAYQPQKAQRAGIAFDWQDVGPCLSNQPITPSGFARDRAVSKIPNRCQINAPRHTRALIPRTKKDSSCSPRF